MHEQVKLRVFKMPCCEHNVCWINPRLPNFCPECGMRVLMALRLDGTNTIQIETCWLSSVNEAQAEDRATNRQDAYPVIPLEKIYELLPVDKSMLSFDEFCRRYGKGR